MMSHLQKFGMFVLGLILVPWLSFADCSDLGVVMQARYGLNSRQTDAIIAILEKKGPTQITQFRKLLAMIPEANYELLQLAKRDSAERFMRVLTILAQENLGEVFLGQGKLEKLTPDQQLALNVVLEKVWRARRTKSWLAQLREWAKHLRVSSYLERMYNFRERKLGEKTRVEDFLKTFAIDNYTAVADLMHATQSAEQLTRVLKNKISFLESEIKKIKWAFMRRIYYRTEIRKAQAMVAILEGRLEDWKNEALQLNLELNSPLRSKAYSTWWVEQIFPNWKTKWVGEAEDILKPLIAGLLLYAVSDNFVLWHNEMFNPFVPHEVDPAVAKELPYHPSDPRPMTEEERKKMYEEMLKQGKPFFDLEGEE